MLDIETAKSILDDIREQTDMKLLTLEDVCHMQPVPVAPNGSGHTIFAVQHNDQTILVKVKITEDSGVSVRKVQTLYW